MAKAGAAPLLPVNPIVWIFIRTEELKESENVHFFCVPLHISHLDLHKATITIFSVFSNNFLIIETCNQAPTVWKICFALLRETFSNAHSNFFLNIVLIYCIMLAHVCALYSKLSTESWQNRSKGDTTFNNKVWLCKILKFCFCVDLLFYRFLLWYCQDLVLAKLVNAITVTAPQLLWALLFRLMSLIQ